MKISVSLSDLDLEVIDRYMAASGATSRSAVIQHAIRRLEETRLEADYEAAWDELANAQPWDGGPDGAAPKRIGSTRGEASGDGGWGPDELEPGELEPDELEPDELEPDELEPDVSGRREPEPEGSRDATR